MNINKSAKKAVLKILYRLELVPDGPGPSLWNPSPWARSFHNSLLWTVASPLPGPVQDVDNQINCEVQCLDQSKMLIVSPLPGPVQNVAIKSIVSPLPGPVQKVDNQINFESHVRNRGQILGRH